MKKFLMFALIVLSFLSTSAQCPVGNVVLTTQTDVDALANNFPDCMEIDGDFTINSSPSDPITDLTPLENITSVTGSLVILKLDYFDQDLEEIVVTELDGLENLTSAQNVYIGNPSPVPTPPSLFGSLDPLNGLSGSIGEFWFSKLELTVPPPDFPNVTSIDYFRFSNVSGVESIPAFTGLTTVRDFTVSQSGSVPNDLLTNLVIPNSLISITAENNPDTEMAGFYLFSSSQIQQVTGGAMLNLIEGEVSINGMPALEDMSGFNNVLEAGQLNMELCRQGAYESFLNLELAESINLPILASSCDNFGGNSVTISFGEMADGLDVTGPQGINVTAEGIEEIIFTGNYNTLGHLEISSPEIQSIVGFNTLAEIVGDNSPDLVLATPNLNQLPDFSSLTTVAGKLELMRSPAGPAWSLVDLTGFENLNTVGSVVIGPITAPADHALESLDGLSGLTSITDNITVRNLPNLTDVEAFGTSVGFEGVLSLFNLPNLENCGNSEVICHLLSAAESADFSGNGVGCDDAVQIGEGCLSVGLEDAFNAAPEINMYFDQNAQWHVETTQAGWYDLFLSDLTGKTILSQRVFLNSGHEIIDISVSLNTGLYLAVWTHDQNRGTAKLLYTAQ